MAIQPRAGKTQLASRGDHLVQFYERDAVLNDAVSGYLLAGLESGDAAVAIATPDHRAAIARQLVTSGVDVAAECAASRLILLDAAETLAAFMLDQHPDPARFNEVIGGVLASAACDGRHVHAFGEMVALLVADGHAGAAIELEALWNALQQATHAFTLFCSYPMSALGNEALSASVQQVCAEHSRVVPAESYMELRAPQDRLRAIVVLQQQARALEAEIEERKLVEEHLRVALAMERAARDEAQAALQLRDEFLSIASHELRTPVAAVISQAQLALRRIEKRGQVDPDSVVRALRQITGQGGKLARLLTQLLDVSRLEAGTLILDRQPTDLCPLVDQTVAMAQSLHPHMFVVSRPASMIACVDGLRLEQVLTNLLTNAAKYSPDGGQIEVELCELDGGRGIELAVRDHGLGIPTDKRAGIFERYFQAHSDGYRSGMGLGLYISRQIVDLHGGTIQAEFPPTGGTRMVIHLPA